MSTGRPAIPDHEWVSCNPREFPSVGWSIHLIRTSARRQQWQTTRCGATASLPGIWRRPPVSSPKPLCAECAKVAKRVGF